MTSRDENVVRATLFNPWRRPFAPDIYINALRIKIARWVVDSLSIAKMTIESIPKLAKRLSLALSKRSHARLDVTGGDTTVIFLDEFNARRRASVRVRSRCHTYN